MIPLLQLQMAHFCWLVITSPYQNVSLAQVTKLPTNLLQELPSLLELAQKYKEKAKKDQKENAQQRWHGGVGTELNRLLASHFHIMPLRSSYHRRVSSHKRNAPLLHLPTVRHSTPENQDQSNSLH